MAAPVEDKVVNELAQHFEAKAKGKLTNQPT